MSYQPRSTNPYIMEKKLNECVGGGGGGFDPSVLEEIEAEISVLGSENATMAQDIIDIKGSLNSLNDNLSGFKFYPTGTQIVGLIADDSAYTDANGNYILADSATGRGLIDNVTYKSISSTEDCRGEVGADTATPFKGKVEEPILLTNTYKSLNANQQYTNFTLDVPMTGFRYIVINHTQYRFGDTSKLTTLDGFYNPQSFIELETFKTTELSYLYDDNGDLCGEYYQYVDDLTIKAKSRAAGFDFTVWGIK